MSTPLKDIGRLQLPEWAHSYYVARQKMTNIPVVTQIARLAAKHAKQQLLLSSLASDIHESKGLGPIRMDVEGSGTPEDEQEAS